MARLALTTVSSSRTTMSPALTISPSRTLTSPTTPPVGCCTFLTLESTTTEPGAISAPEICTVEAQPPNPPASTSISARPTIRCAAYRAARAFQLGGHDFFAAPASDTILIGGGGATRCSTWPSTVSFGPNACMRPSFSTSN